MVGARTSARSYDFSITQTALHLCAKILVLQQSSPELPSSFTSDVLKQSQTAPPRGLLYLFMVLCTGSEHPGEPDIRSESYVMSASADALFATTNDHPGMHQNRR